MTFLTHNNLTDFGWLQPYVKDSSRIGLITDEPVKRLYAEKIAEQLIEEGYLVSLHTFAGKDASKTRATKERLEDDLMRSGLDRNGLILALGGGVVLDIAGFVAATYLRGIPYINIPTTLLAMIDASIGGKVAINTPYMKNAIGAFYPPLCTLLHPPFLNTLPEDERKNGLAEAIKYACIASPSLIDPIRSAPLADLIAPCVAIKQEIVRQDPTEKGLRRMLNFGHTVGHAIETTLDYQIPHGLAVAIGMRIEAHLSHQLGYLPLVDLQTIDELLCYFDYPKMIHLDKNRFFTALQKDKKAEGSSPRFVLLQTIGSVLPFDGEYCSPCPQSLLEEVLLAHCHFT